MIRTINFQFCIDKDDADLPLAIARFTTYNEDGSIWFVEQITYEDDSNYFQTEVLAAINGGSDLCVLSPFELKDFKWLNELVNA